MRCSRWGACIDRMYLNVYVPGLQCAAGLVAYVHQQLGLPIASTPPLAKITDAFSAAVHRFVRTGGVPWVDFAKGQRKDDVMHEHLERFTGSEGGAVRRASAGEDEVVSYRAPPRLPRRFLPVNRGEHRAGEPFLLLLPRR